MCWYTVLLKKKVYYFPLDCHNYDSKINQMYHTTQHQHMTQKESELCIVKENIYCDGHQ